MSIRLADGNRAPTAEMSSSMGECHRREALLILDESVCVLVD